MDNLTDIIALYPNLKKIIARDTPQIYNKITNTQYVKDAKLSPNIGLIYDFGGTEGPVEGNNVIIVDYNPNGSSKPSDYKEKYDKNLNIYKFNDYVDKKNVDITLPNNMEVNGNLFIAYVNILNFPKVLKTKTFHIFECKIKDNLFNSKLLIDGDLEINRVFYNGTNIIEDLKTPEIDTMDKLVDKIRNLIENNGGYIKGNIKISDVSF